MDSYSVVIPEVKIFNALQQIIQGIRTDYEKKSPEDSYLYRICNDNAIERFNFFEQAVHVFTKNSRLNEPRTIEANIGWNFERITKKIPTIHIIMNAENPKDDSIGLGHGNYQDFYEETDEHVQVIERKFNQTCMLVITSDNAIECMLIYHVIKHLLISYFDLFEIQGMQNVRISGREMEVNQQIPDRIASRFVFLSYDYAVKAPHFNSNEIIREIFYTIKPKLE